MFAVCLINVAAVLYQVHSVLTSFEQIIRLSDYCIIETFSVSELEVSVCPDQLAHYYNLVL